MLTVRAANNLESELSTANRLQQLARTFNLARFQFTAAVVVDAKSIPHSHPVLTLRTGYASDDALLAEFLHEQMHWFLGPHLDALKRAVQEIETMFPQLPIGLPLGARDRWSSYLHLAVNTLELRSVAIFVGEYRARDVLGAWQHYRGIYRIVLDDTERVEEVLRRFAIDIDRVDAQRS